MRNYFLLTAVVVAISMVSVTASAGPAAPKDAKTGHVTKDSSQIQAAKDPNYRWYNGQWWYWMPKEKSWVIWSGGEWVPHQPAQVKTGAVDSFSYEGASPSDDSYGEGTRRLFGTPLSTVPDSVSTNNQIIGSFGIRGAGSKMLGNY